MHPHAFQAFNKRCKCRRIWLFIKKYQFVCCLFPFNLASPTKLCRSEEKKEEKEEENEKKEEVEVRS